MKWSPARVETQHAASLLFFPLYNTGRGAGEDKLTREANASKLGSALLHPETDFRQAVGNKLDQESSP